MKAIKVLATALAVWMLIGLVGCAAPAENLTSDKELFDIGMDLIGIQEEMIESDAYRSIMGVRVSDEEMEKLAEGVYDSPPAVYSITLADPDVLLKIITDIDGKEWNEMSETLKEQIKLRISFTSIFTAINSARGADAIVLSTQCAASKKLETLALDEEKIFLYVFETGTPIAVWYRDGVASSYFLFLEEAGTIEDIRKAFVPYKCDVEKLNIN